MDAEMQICEFCLIEDPNLSDEHYRECPMWTQCWECNNMVEIALVEEHLIKECPQSYKYKYCEDCEAVYLHEEFDGHECEPNEPKGAARCPLCSEMVYPNSREAW
jgi:hypothetical protein